MANLFQEMSTRQMLALGATFLNTLPDNMTRQTAQVIIDNPIIAKRILEERLLNVYPVIGEKDSAFYHKKGNYFHTEEVIYRAIEQFCYEKIGVAFIELPVIDRPPLVSLKSWSQKFIDKGWTHISFSELLSLGALYPQLSSIYRAIYAFGTTINTNEDQMYPVITSNDNGKTRILTGESANYFVDFNAEMDRVAVKRVRHYHVDP